MLRRAIKRRWKQLVREEAYEEVMRHMGKTFTVVLFNGHSSYEVHGDSETSLDSVWNSQKCFFLQGTRVLISDGLNEKVFEKE